MQNENKITPNKIDNLFNKKLTILYEDGSFALKSNIPLNDVIHKLAILEKLLEKHGIINFPGLQRLLNTGEVKKLNKTHVPLFTRIGETEIEYTPTKKSIKLEIGIHPIFSYPILKKDNNTIYVLKWEDIVKLSGLSNFLKEDFCENN